MERIKKYEPLFGRWYVTKYLGGGSFGSVYQIYSEKDGIQSNSAVKYISIRKQDYVQNIEGSSLMETASAGNDTDSFPLILKKIKREIELLQKLQGHSNIVTIYDYDIFSEESETVLLIRMELLTSLSDYRKKHSFDKKDVIRLGASLCNALESCSRMQIVHRDIKPDNIFVNCNGEFKLGDFGLSCQNTASASQSLRGQKGTPIYMAPESLNWGQKADHRTDLYAVAIVLYQLLNEGRIPFCADMQDMEALQEAIMSRMQKKEMEPPKDDNGILWGIIKKACSYEMENRYQSAAEMKMQLEALLVKKMVSKAYDTESPGMKLAKEALNQGDRAKALQLYEEEAKHGNLKAQLMAGSIYSDGIGGVTRPYHALPYYEMAAEQGDIKAMEWLGSFHLTEAGHSWKTQSTEEMGIEYLEKAVEAGSAAAALRLARHYRDRYSPKYHGYYEMAFRRYQQRAAENDPEAIAQLGFAYLLGWGTEKDEQTAMKCFEQAANLGNPEAQHKMGETAKKPEEKFYWFEKAAVQGYTSSELRLAECYEKGLGVKKDTKKALYWYERAADKGRTMAKSGVERLKKKKKFGLFSF